MCGDIIVVDFQGFCVPEFVVKELTIFNGSVVFHNTFKCIQPYSTLCESLKKQVWYLERHHHLLQYTSGNLNPCDVQQILINNIILKNYETIYVKGYQKKKFLSELLNSFDVVIYDLDDGDDCPKLIKKVPELCNYHMNNFIKCFCSLNNAKHIYKYCKETFSQ